MRLIGLAVVLAVSLALAPLATEGRQSGKMHRRGFLLPVGDDTTAVVPQAEP